MTSTRDSDDEFVEITEIFKKISFYNDQVYSLLNRKAWYLIDWMRTPKGMAITIPTLLIISALVWLGRPLNPIHRFAMWAYTEPLVAIVDAVSLGFFVRRVLTNKRVPLKVVLLVTVIDMAVLPFFSNAYMKQFFVNDLPVTSMKELPETTYTRWLPYEVARELATDTMQESTLELGDFHSFDYEFSEITWVAPQVPAGSLNKLFEKPDGFKLIRQDGTVTTYHEPMMYGEGICCTDHIMWQLRLRHYWMEIGEIYYMEYEGRVLALAPYTTYYLHFPLMLPKWGGIFVVHGDGTIEDLTPEEAQTDLRFVGQRLYPKALAYQAGHAWAWRLGWYNFFFKFIDKTEVPKLEGGSYQFPFLIPTEEGPMWFIPLDPAGSGQGIFKMLFIDAHSGIVQLYQLPADSSLLGPNVSKDYLRGAFRDINWTQAGQAATGNIIALEPRPVVKNSTLYWMLTVTTKDHSGINFTGLINASPKAREVLAFDNPAELEAFLLHGIRPTTKGTLGDITQMNTPDLGELLNKIVEELMRRTR